MNEYKNKTYIYMLVIYIYIYIYIYASYKRFTSESEGMENVIPCKWKSKENWSDNTHIRQSKLSVKVLQETKKDIKY